MKVKIDLDKANAIYNEREKDNPNFVKQTRKDIVENENLSLRTIIYWKNGKTPEAFSEVFSLAHRLNLTTEEIISLFEIEK